MPIPQRFIIVRPVLADSTLSLTGQDEGFQILGF